MLPPLMLFLVLSSLSGDIASLFWMDDALCSRICLDGIVTVVDAQHCLQHLTEQHSAETQIPEAVK
jgi:G3E family GTPase